jgi:hypothetical protein
MALIVQCITRKLIRKSPVRDIKTFFPIDDFKRGEGEDVAVVDMNIFFKAKQN